MDFFKQLNFYKNLNHRNKIKSAMNIGSKLSFKKLEINCIKFSTFSTLGTCFLNHFILFTIMSFFLFFRHFDDILV